MHKSLREIQLNLLIKHNIVNIVDKFFEEIHNFIKLSKYLYI